MVDDTRDLVRSILPVVYTFLLDMVGSKTVCFGNTLGNTETGLATLKSTSLDRDEVFGPSRFIPTLCLQTYKTIQTISEAEVGPRVLSV